MKVIISSGFGSGFSTWGDPRMAIDSDIVDLVEKGFTKEEMESLCIQKGYIEEYSYLGGIDSLSIQEVPEGKLFKIREYDGAEWIEIFNPDEWFKAID